MTLNVLFAGNPPMWSEYESALNAAFQEQGIDAFVSNSMAPDTVDYLVFSPNGPVEDFTPFTKARAVLGLWAGVETVVHNKTLTQPYTRMSDIGLREGMCEWVTGHVLRYHLEMDHDICNHDASWGRSAPPLARDRKVSVLGLGALGGAVAHTLAALNFQTSGWSKSQKTIDGITCYSGEDGLRDILADTEILVLLLPSTSETENLLNEKRLAWLPKGARIINPGRGPLIDDDALLAALDCGHISHATLDVFRCEPLPKDDPYWSHPSVTVTPHIASQTRPDSAARVVAENVRRCEAGKDLLYLVDRDAGY